MSLHHSSKRAVAYGRPARVSAAIVAIALAVASGTARAQSTEDRPELYPDAPHREETFYACTACHSFRIVAAQGMTRDTWAETLTWMTAKHNLPKLKDKDLDNVLDYLAVAFPPKAPVQGGWKNPFGN
ncbi:MAG: hypothetical protein NW217_00155 [Hyphomicrobiaceae bacterium]|nr:hypothetical protein [Hyphomicrobiaceae bacterium]